MNARVILVGRRLRRPATKIVGGVAAVAAPLLLALAAFPWGMVKPIVERRLSAQLGRPVTIARIDRLDMLSLMPTIAVRDVRVPQAGWAGAGDMARIARVEITFRALPILVGRFNPTAIRVAGARIALMRARDGRENWRRPGPERSGGAALALSGLSVTDSMVSYRDGKAGRGFTARVAADAARGVRLAGTGLVRGRPVTIAVRGAAVDGMAGRPWPFRARIDGPALTIDARGTMDAPLDPTGVTIDLAARADDLKLIDAVIEAGLFGTQQVRLTAHARKDRADWAVSRIAGTVGRSRVAGAITVRKRAGRAKIDGDVTFDTLDFDDLASDAGLARGAALERAIGPRLVPNTWINIARIDKTDGIVRFAARHVIGGRRRSAITSLKGAIALDHQLAIVAPLTIGLTRGTIAGSLRIDQAGGRTVPMVTIDLRLVGSDVDALAGGDGRITARVDGRARLRGIGSTLREAVGRSSGTIGLAARDGSLPRRTAALIGFDAGRALTAGGDDRTLLRCAVVRLDMRGGVGTADPFVIDTGTSQARGVGQVRFPGETLAIRLTGAPKRGSLLRLPGSATLDGTIHAPRIVVPPRVKSVGNVLTAIGRTITDTQGPTAEDADCGALSARALGR